MSLFGLAPATFALGALLLAGGLALLHLLRVRLRSVEVDTLLFFRLAGALQKPRVLPGRPARWFAFVLALLVALAAWLAMAEPRSGLQDASRFLVVEPDQQSGEARLEQVRSLALAGLGPRGAILAATLPPTLLLAAGEPANVLEARAAALQTTATALGERAAWQSIGDRRLAGDEVVWLGARPALAEFPVVHAPVARAPVGVVRGLRWQRAAGTGPSLLLQWEGDAVPVELRVGDTVTAAGMTKVGAGELLLGPVAVPANGAPLRCAIGTAAAFVVPWPTTTPLRVHVDPSLPVDLAIALASILEADEELVEAPEATAEVVVSAQDVPEDARPRLVLLAGHGGGARLAVNTAAAPVACSLRDRQPRDAGALPELPGARVWIADEAQGGALAAATSSTNRRIWIVDWLLRPRTHADVPLLLLTSLRALGDREASSMVALAGQPLAVPAAFPAALAAGALLPVDSVLPLHERTSAGLAIASPVAAISGSQPTLAAIGGDGSWVPWLLSLLVLLLAVDAMLFHRGRLP